MRVQRLGSADALEPSKVAYILWYHSREITLPLLVVTNITNATRHYHYASLPSVTELHLLKTSRSEYRCNDQRYDCKSAISGCA